MRRYFQSYHLNLHPSLEILIKTTPRTNYILKHFPGIDYWGATGEPLNNVVLSNQCYASGNKLCKDRVEDIINNVTWNNRGYADQGWGVGFRCGTRTNPNIWNLIFVYTPVVGVGKNLPLQHIFAPWISIMQKGCELWAYAWATTIDVRHVFYGSGVYKAYLHITSERGCGILTDKPQSLNLLELDTLHLLALPSKNFLATCATPSHHPLTVSPKQPHSWITSGVEMRVLG